SALPHYMGNDWRPPNTGVNTDPRAERLSGWDRCQERTWQEHQPEGCRFDRAARASVTRPGPARVVRLYNSAAPESAPPDNSRRHKHLPFWRGCCGTCIGDAVNAPIVISADNMP